MPHFSSIIGEFSRAVQNPERHQNQPKTLQMKQKLKHPSTCCFQPGHTGAFPVSGALLPSAASPPALEAGPSHRRWSQRRARPRSASAPPSDSLGFHFDVWFVPALWVLVCSVWWLTMGLWVLGCLFKCMERDVSV